MRNSEGEKEYWREQEAKILILMLVPISLSGVFYDEHARRTDQMILCCSFGKITLYGIKIAAGISFAVVSTVIYLIVSVGIVLAGKGWYQRYQICGR